MLDLVDRLASDAKLRGAADRISGVTSVIAVTVLATG
jgi:hypothetical protein